MKNCTMLLKKKTIPIDLSDKGIVHLSGKTSDNDFFVLPDIGVKIGQIDESEDSL